MEGGLHQAAQVCREWKVFNSIFCTIICTKRRPYQFAHLGVEAAVRQHTHCVYKWVREDEWSLLEVMAQWLKLLTRV